MVFGKVLCLAELNLAEKGAFVMISRHARAHMSRFLSFKSVFFVSGSNPDVLFLLLGKQRFMLKLTHI